MLKFTNVNASDAYVAPVCDLCPVQAASSVLVNSNLSTVDDWTLDDELINL